MQYDERDGKCLIYKNNVPHNVSRETFKKGANEWKK